MRARIHYGIEVRTKLRGIDPGGYSRGIRDDCSRHESTALNRSQFSDRRSVSAHDDGSTGLHLAQHLGRLIAKFSLCDGADIHKANVAHRSILWHTRKARDQPPATLLDSRPAPDGYNDERCPCNNNLTSRQQSLCYASQPSTPGRPARARHGRSRRCSRQRSQRFSSQSSPYASATRWPRTLRPPLRQSPRPYRPRMPNWCSSHPPVRARPSVRR